MGKLLLLVALVMILLIGCSSAIAGKAFSDLSNVQKQFYWKCLDSDGCLTLLKNKQYSPYKACSLNCIEKSGNYTIEQGWCNDSDNGANYLIKGIITTNLNPTGKEDYCYTFPTGKEYLMEGGCKNNAYMYYQKNCAELGAKFKCGSGACFIPNQAPTLNPIGDKEVKEGEELSFEVTATDENGDELTYSVEGLPEGATFENKVFTWTPTYEQAGTYEVTSKVSDGELSNEEVITITVTDVLLNNAPILKPIGNKNVKEGGTLSFTINANDQEGDVLTYSATDLPVGAIFDQDIRTFFWNPDYEQAGTYSVTFIVSDGNSEDNETITIDVTNEEVPNCVVPVDGMIITENTIFCEGNYYLPNGVKIVNNGITLDCSNANVSGNNNNNGQSPSGITINSTSSITIKNCEIDNYFRGIHILNSSNIFIHDNTLLPKLGNTALDIIDGSNSFAKNNQVLGTTYIVWESYNNKLFQNTFMPGGGINSVLYFMSTSHNNYIKGNTFSNGEDGVNFQHGTYENVVEDNEFKDNWRTGIVIINSKNNIIRYNKLDSSNVLPFNDPSLQPIGIQLHDNSATGNLIYGNDISGMKTCIVSKETYNNTIYNNNFFNCDTPVYDQLSTTWNTQKKGGNYWDVFNEPSEGCSDLDTDGICDSPFVIDIDSQDNLPYTQMNGWK